MHPKMIEQKTAIARKFLNIDSPCSYSILVDGVVARNAKNALRRLRWE